MRARLWILLVLPAAMAASCSQSLSGTVDGTGGAGAGGAAAASGTGGGAGGTGGILADCQRLQIEYQAALTAAQSCDLGGTGQCGEMVPSGLTSCVPCAVYVTDASKVKIILQHWNVGNCASLFPQGCVSGPCLEPLGGVCLPTPTGTGICSFDTGSGGSNGGTGGSGGSPGTGGSPADGGQPDVCAGYVAKYAAVLNAVSSCTPRAANQCGQPVPASLSPCTSGCATYVNDASPLDDIRKAWEQAGCQNVAVACPAIACIASTGGVCTVSDGGGGSCSTTYQVFAAPGNR